MHFVKSSGAQGIQGQLGSFFRLEYESSPLTLVENEPNSIFADCNLSPWSFGSYWVVVTTKMTHRENGSKNSDITFD